MQTWSVLIFLKVFELTDGCQSESHYCITSDDVRVQNADTKKLAKMAPMALDVKLTAFQNKIIPTVKHSGGSVVIWAALTLQDYSSLTYCNWWNHSQSSLTFKLNHMNIMHQDNEWTTKNKLAWKTSFWGH